MFKNVLVILKFFYLLAVQKVEHVVYDAKGIKIQSVSKYWCTCIVAVLHFHLLTLLWRHFLFQLDVYFPTWNSSFFACFLCHHSLHFCSVSSWMGTVFLMNCSFVVQMSVTEQKGKLAFWLTLRTFYSVCNNKYLSSWMITVPSKCHTHREKYWPFPQKLRKWDLQILGDDNFSELHALITAFVHLT